MAKSQFRPTAIPLLVNDPFFSIWSFSDRLFDDNPRHWTGRTQGLFGGLFIDGTLYRFLGKMSSDSAYIPERQTLRQISVQVTPTATKYTFSHPTCTLKVTFLSPLLADRLDILSRPVSYVFYEIQPKEEGHQFEMYIDATSSICGDNLPLVSCFSEEGHAYMGATEQKVLNRSGDDHRIDWGYLHLVHPNAKCGVLYLRNLMDCQMVVSRSRSKLDISQPIEGSRIPILSARSEKLSDVFVFAYDDVKSIDFFHTPADAYYKKSCKTFDAMLKKAVADADLIRRKCATFDRKLMARMKQISPAYEKIGSLAYRQTIAAHKLIVVDGEAMFLSKECFSNGCINTLDVTYPSIPLFLALNPELVRAMMRPLLRYAASDAWPYRYAPHDCGQYPLCNGQVYSTVDGKLVEDKQMPVEECGNAILTVAAAAFADGNRTLADSYREMLTQWADYLVEFGYDPGMQLCTDDFAGHLAHNCNLSLKAIVALGAFAKLYDAPKYAKIAKEMADRWTKEAKCQNAEGYRLTFDRDDSWSMKYNIVWDRLMGLGLFAPSVSAEEIKVYKKEMKRYGVPLDCRSDYTKLDWLEWTTVMTDDAEYREEVIEAIARMITESLDRVPITDWYFASTARQRGFQARSVLGGFYINLLV